MTEFPQVVVGTTLFGRPMSQTWEDVRLYERLLNAHPELHAIIELGTGQGGLSFYLNFQAAVRGMTFKTFDVVRPDAEVPNWQRLDVLREVDEVVRHFSHPMLLVCDNGNKPLEVGLYAPKLQKGDLLTVHDWDTEIYVTDIPTTLWMVHEDWCQSMTRVFERIA